MKSILKKTCLALFIIGATALNAQNSNNLVVFSETGDRFYLVLNGLKYNQSPETNVKVTNLNATNYKAKIIFEKPLDDLNSTVHLMWEGNAVTGKEFTYAVTRHGDKHKLRFVSQADLGTANAAASNSVVYNANGTLAGGSTSATTDVANTSTTINTNNNTVAAGINGGGYNSTTTITTTTTTGNNPNGAVGMNMNVDGMNMSVNINGAGMGTNTNSNSNTTVTTTTTSYTTSSTSYAGGGVQNTNVNNTATNTNYNTSGTTTGGCYAPMADASFQDLKASISAKSFEDARLKVAKQGVSANCVSTAQVRQLMDLFTFEDNKLEITKYCYDYTTDKNNYFKVNDGFGFEASVDTLNDYISQKR